MVIITMQVMEQLPRIESIKNYACKEQKARATRSSRHQSRADVEASLVMVPGPYLPKISVALVRRADYDHDCLNPSVRDAALAVPRCQRCEPMKSQTLTGSGCVRCPELVSKNSISSWDGR